MSILPYHFRQGNEVIERLSNSHMVTQLGGGRANADFILIQSHA